MVATSVAKPKQRVLTEERQRFGKITDVARLRDALARWNFTRTISSRESIEIDNSALVAEEVAQRIAAGFTLLIV